jgi:hypothetical protein
MVKLGFIGDGATEKIILENTDLFDHLKSLNIEFVADVIDAKGNGNLLPHNLQEYTQILEDKGANRIIILTDLDQDQCITLTKERIKPLENHTLIISVKEIETWFLSDTEAMRKFLNDPEFIHENPESIAEPFEEIKSIRILKNGRGVSDKKILARQMIKSNFSILQAAKHPNCNSAKYFLRKIAEFA